MNESIFQMHRFRHYYQRLHPMFSTHKSQAYTMLLMSVLTITFFSVFAIKPTIKTITSLKKQIQDGEALNKQLEDKINALILAQESFRQLEKDLSTVYSLLPPQAEFPSLLRKIEIITLENQATISSIQFDSLTLYDRNLIAESESENVLTDNNIMAQTLQNTPINFSLVMEGKYDKLILFLEHLTKLDRLITIDSVNFSPDTAEETPANVTLNLNLSSKAFYLP